MATTKQQVAAAILALKAIADSIRDLGRVPQGHLYAEIMGHCTLEQFDRAVDIIVGSGLVRKEGLELVWVGPPADEAGK